MAVVTLTINADGSAAIVESSRVSKSVTGMGKDGARAGKELEEGGKRGAVGLRTAAEEAKKAGIAIGAMAAAAAAGLALMVRNSINNADASMKMAQASGVTVEAFSGLAFAAQLAGVEQGQLAQLMQATTRQAVEAANGTGRAAEAYAAMGISVRDQEGRLKSADILLQEISGRLRQLPDGAEKTALAIATLGRSGAEAIPLLNSEIEKLVSQAERLGLVFTEQTAKAAERFNDNLTVLGASARGFANRIVESLIPALASLSDQSAQAAEDQSFLARSADFISDTFKGAVIVVMGMVDGVRLLADVAAATAITVVKVFSEMGNAIAAEGRQIGSVLTALASRDAAAMGRAVIGIGSGVETSVREIREAVTREMGLIGESYDRTIQGTTDRMAALFGPTQALEGPARVLAETFGYMAGQAGTVSDELESLLAAERALLDQAAELTAQLEGPAAVAQHQYELAIRAVREQMDELAQAQAVAGNSTLDLTAAKRAQTVVETALARIRDKTLADLARERDIVGQVTARYKEDMAVMQMSAREAFIYAEAQDAIAAAIDAGNPLQAEQIELITEMAGELFDLSEHLGDVEDILSEFGDGAFDSLLWQTAILRTEMERLSDPMSDAFDPARAGELERAIERINTRIQIETIDSYKAMLGAAQAFTKEGSKGFRAMEAGMAALSIIQDIIALKAGVSAVLTQGQGDPYSAWARMAAMAAAVAPYLASIGVTLSSFGGSGGGFSDTAGQRQATQGTGTVLGDASAQSESIANATEITADATSSLVGINRGMLRALIQLQSSIGSATAMLARGAGQAGFSDLPAAGRLGGSFSSVVDPLNLFGGSRKITDQGIVIVGDILEGIIVGAYQEVQSRSWRFGRRRTREEVVPVADELATQFNLIIESIVSTVRAGAETLGLLPDEVQAAIEAFEVEEIRISLMGLSAEEQQAELQAVFSAIFDDLAGSVAPFIAQFQKVGEGLGETLVRVATGVQVTREAMEQLGIAIDETDPERFAQISEGLIEMSGGLESFISGMLNFVDRFATEEHKFETAQRTLNAALAEVGLTVPETRAEMWELMQSLDATTEAGRAQIATLLSVAGAADIYYRAVERQADANARAAAEAEAAAAAEAEAAAAIERAKESYASFAQGLREQLAEMGMSDFALELRDIERWSQATQAELHRLAIEAGEAAAAESDLAVVHEITARRTAAAIATLQASAEALARRLTGTDLQGIDEQIRELEAAQQSSYNAQLGGINDVGNAAAEMYAQQLQALQQITDWLDSQLLSSLSSLTPMEQLAEARRQFEAAAAAAPTDANAAAALPGLANTLLQLGQGAFASGTGFVELEQFVRETMQGVAGALGNATAGGPPMVQLAPGWSAEVGGSVSEELRALYAERDALLLEQQAAEQRALWGDLSMMVASIIAATGAPLDAVLASLNITAAQMAAGIGINEEDLMGYIDGLTQTALITELGALVDIHAVALDQAAELRMQTSIFQAVQIELARIANMTAAQNAAADLPGFAMGGWVNGPTRLLAGEAGRELILPNAVSEFFARAGIPVNSGSNAELVTEVRALRTAFERTNTDTRDALATRLDRVVSGVTDVATATRQSGETVAREVRSGTEESRNRRY